MRAIVPYDHITRYWAAWKDTRQKLRLRLPFPSVVGLSGVLPSAAVLIVAIGYCVYTFWIMPTKRITISTRRARQVSDITEEVEQFVAETGIAEGLCNVFVTHTTAGLTTGEAIEGTDEDLLEVLDRIIPKIKFRHAHDPSHAPDHMISSILGSSLTVPVQSGRLALGTWQRVLLVECNGPRKREIVFTVLA